MLVDLKLILILLFRGPWNVKISAFGTELILVLLLKSLQSYAVIRILVGATLKLIEMNVKHSSNNDT